MLSLFWLLLGLVIEYKKHSIKLILAIQTNETDVQKKIEQVLLLPKSDENFPILFEELDPSSQMFTIKKLIFLSLILLICSRNEIKLTIWNKILQITSQFYHFSCLNARPYKDKITFKLGRQFFLNKLLGPLEKIKKFLEWVPATKILKREYGV